MWKALLDLLKVVLELVFLTEVEAEQGGQFVQEFFIAELEIEKSEGYPLQV